MDRRRRQQLDRPDRPARAALPHCRERNARPWLAEPRACRLRGRLGPAEPVVRCNTMYSNDFRELKLAIGFSRALDENKIDFNKIESWRTIIRVKNEQPKGVS